MFFSRFKKTAKKTETGDSAKSGFKVGDYVRVNDGIKIENGEFTENWAGKVLEIYNEGELVNITFDAVTLDNISDAYLLNCEETGGDHYSYNFYAKELTKIERRDTEEVYKSAAKAYDLRFAIVTGDQVSMEEEMQDKWFGLFSNSPFFEQLNEAEKENANFAIDVFTNYYFNYVDNTLLECTPDDVAYMCVDILPRKVTDDGDFFENLGPIIIAFFEFLEAEGYTQADSKQIKKRVLSLKDEIVEASENPTNWGMAKSMMMKATEMGYDTSSQDDLNAFMQEFNALSFAERKSVTGSFQQAPYVNQDLYKDFKRNTKVSVRYPGGKIKEYVSFKRVEQDLRSGKCTLI